MDEWFEVVRLSEALFAISEPRHYEHTVVYLLIGSGRALLIDTGCGIGDLRRFVRELTPYPISVVNTHTHLDHLGGNYQFSDIAMFDHTRTRLVAEQGAPKEVYFRELLQDGLVTPPWPVGFRRDQAYLPPVQVSHWLKEGEILKVAGIELEVVHTPGEAPDHICLLDRINRVLFCGDILLNGPVWAHLVGGNVEDLHRTYQRLMSRYDEFDILMPGHNGSSLGKEVLPIALEGVEKLLAGRAPDTFGSDPWGRAYKRYEFEGISILTHWPLRAASARA